MAELKTKATAASVESFLAGIEPAGKRADARALCALMERVSGQPPVMWGPSIVGFGRYSYRYDSGHAGEMCKVGFSPRKAALTLYLAGAVSERPDLVARLGKVKTGVGCIYVKRLADADLGVLEALVESSLTWVDEKYPGGAGETP